ncbi:hypothetical protein [Marinomonas shanghaiensis]|uniref:hypothetical protein n=1 Tax=Marinomonas shanghaiensis TaxID=2202418 RepID=UPI003A90A222
MLNKLRRKVKELEKEFKGEKEIRYNERKIFIFGAPHSGKSTFTSELINYIDLHKDFILRRDPINNKNGVIQISEWCDNHQCGKFPLQTQSDTIIKINIEFLEKEIEGLNRIVLYEISGEKTMLFDPVHDDSVMSGSENTATEIIELKKFLEESDCVMIFASSKPDSTEEKNRILNFLELVDRTYPKKPICLILTKFDLIRGDYKNPSKAIKDLYYSTAEILFSKDNSIVFDFSVGVVGVRKISEDESENYISKNQSEDYLEDIFDYMRTI